MESKNNKKEPWIRSRHRLVRVVAGAVLQPYVRLRYGIRVERFDSRGRQYLIAMNHQTAFDQFFVGLAFKDPVYFIATEDIFSIGFVSKVIRFLVNPIPIKKQTNDLRAVMTCMRVAREGGTIALAPEGNRTYSGRTCYIKPSIVKLTRALKLPLAIFRIEGGYGVQPRWSDVIRRGRMRAYVSRVVEPEEYKNMTDEALLRLIEESLWVDEASLGGEFHHRRRAEYLERAMYVCPYCGLTTFESRGDVTTCRTCGRQIRYLPTKELRGVGFDFPFPFVGQWYDYQCEFVNSLDLERHLTQPLYTDTACLSEVILYQRKKLLRNAVTIRLYGDRMEVDEDLVFPFRETAAVTVLGRNKLNVYCHDRVYQFKGSPRFNALKYVNLFHRYKNMIEDSEHGKFLGL